VFPNKGESFSGLKHLTEKMTAVASVTHVWVMVDHKLPTKIKKGLALTVWSMS